MRVLIQYLLMPLLLLVSFYTYDYTVKENISRPLMLISLGTASFILILLLEYLCPLQLKWKGLGKEEAKDILHSWFGTNLGSFLGNNLNLLLITMTLPLFGESKLDIIEKTYQWPILLQVLLIMLITDLGRYWQHRFHHMNPTLWSFHELHHDDNKLNVFKASRSHFIERVLQQLFMFLPVLVLGFNTDGIFCFIVLNSVLGLLAHSNIRIETGPFDHVLMTPRNHRLHHALDMRMGNTNFGSSTVIWDRIFGTFTSSKGVDFAKLEVGVEEKRVHKTFLKQVLAPFLKLYKN